MIWFTLFQLSNLQGGIEDNLDIGAEEDIGTLEDTVAVGVGIPLAVKGTQSRGTESDKAEEHSPLVAYKLDILPFALADLMKPFL